MFIDRLNAEEQQALFQLLTSVAWADGKLEQQEVKFLEQYANTYEIEAMADTEINVEDSCKMFPSHLSKVVALQELVKISLCDGHYDDAEKSGATVIADYFGISREALSNVESWVREGLEWTKSGELLLSAS